MSGNRIVIDKHEVEDSKCTIEISIYDEGKFETSAWCDNVTFSDLGTMTCTLEGVPTLSKSVGKYEIEDKRKKK